MLSWLRRRRETAERIDAEADVLIGKLGVEAYAEARRREYESSSEATALRWNQIALAVAHKTGKRIGLDTSSRLAMNTMFAPDREHDGDRRPQPFSQVEELKSTLTQNPFRLPVCQLGAGSRTVNRDRTRDSSFGCVGAIVAAASVTWPPRTIGLRILDSEDRRGLQSTEGRSLKEKTRNPDTVRGVSRRR